MKPGSTDPVGVNNETLANDADYQWIMRSTATLRHDVELDLRARHVEALPNPAVPAYTAVDATLTWPIRKRLFARRLGLEPVDPSHPEYGPAASRQRARACGLRRAAPRWALGVAWHSSARHRAALGPKRHRARAARPARAVSRRRAARCRAAARTARHAAPRSASDSRRLRRPRPTVGHSARQRSSGASAATNLRREIRVAVAARAFPTRARRTQIAREMLAPFGRRRAQRRAASEPPSWTTISSRSAGLRPCRPPLSYRGAAPALASRRRAAARQRVGFRDELARAPRRAPRRTRRASGSGHRA